ncbi:YccF domain-containing protein [Alloscardovia criceti]|uniref:YccF domain-containing protein n=1 Tax=Alloscardovia criceti TaxID=356828 RepID=UPI0003A3F90A|nr:YccF domain-containing protein [Alloscardovia criceti]
MRLLGNILWIIFGGFWIALGWLIAGLVLCVTIIGIPLGVQCFKMAELTLTPFGKQIVYTGGGLSFLANIIWAVVFGWVLAVGYFIAGIANCITIIGIPFGLQSFKMMRLAFAPFGASVVEPYQYY